MSEIFDIGLSFCFIVCRRWKLEKNTKKSQKLPVFCHKVREVFRPNNFYMMLKIRSSILLCRCKTTSLYSVPTCLGPTQYSLLSSQFVNTVCVRFLKISVQCCSFVAFSQVVLHDKTVHVSHPTVSIVFYKGSCI